MARQLISTTKSGFTPEQGPVAGANGVFDTYIPGLDDNANIQDALKLFFYGDSTVSTDVEPLSLYTHLVSLNDYIGLTSSNITAHAAVSSGAHGTTGAVVGTENAQTLTNKTLTSPVINNPSFNSGGLAPVGSIMQFAGSSAPSGWLLCDGVAVGRNTYSALFAVIASTYGSGDGATTFNLPNLKGKVVVGLDASQTEFDTLAETGGSKTHTHTQGITGSTATDHAHNGSIGIDALTNNSYTGNEAGHYHNYNVASTSDSIGNHTHTGGNFYTNDAAANAGNKTVATGGNTYGVAASNSHTHTVNFGGGTSAGGGAHTVTINPGQDSTDGTSSHSHTIAHGHNGSVTINTATASHTHTNPTTDANSSLQPYIVLNYIIKH